MVMVEEVGVWGRLFIGDQKVIVKVNESVMLEQVDEESFEMEAETEVVQMEKKVVEAEVWRSVEKLEMEEGLTGVGVRVAGEGNV